MRSSLAPLRGKRTPVAARFAGLSRKGHIILENVRTVAGREPYVWLSFEDWRGRLPFPGSEIRFQATVREYYSDHRNCFDYGLTDIRMEG
jgi:hypothetical protein